MLSRCEEDNIGMLSYAGEAQRAEHPAFNRTVVGSNPSASISDRIVTDCQPATFAESVSHVPRSGEE